MNQLCGTFIEHSTVCLHVTDTTISHGPLHTSYSCLHSGSHFKICRSVVVFIILFLKRPQLLILTAFERTHEASIHLLRSSHLFPIVYCLFFFRPFDHYWRFKSCFFCILHWGHKCWCFVCQQEVGNHTQVTVPLQLDSVR